MTKKYEIVLNYIKDLSVEIPDAQTFIFSKDYITKKFSKYQMVQNYLNLYEQQSI